MTKSIILTCPERVRWVQNAHFLKLNMFNKKAEISLIVETEHYCMIYIKMIIFTYVCIRLQLKNLSGHLSPFLSDISFHKPSWLIKIYPKPETGNYREIVILENLPPKKNSGHFYICTVSQQTSHIWFFEKFYGHRWTPN